MNSRIVIIDLSPFLDLDKPKAPQPQIPCAVSAKAEQHLSYLGSTVKRLEVSCSMIAKPRCCETAKGLRLYKNSNQENRNQLGQVSKIELLTVPYKRSTMSSTMSIHYRLIRQMFSAGAQQGFRG